MKTKTTISNHIPLRRCKVCRNQFPKSELLRWTKLEGVLVQDIAQKATGRGYYSCSEKCAAIIPRVIKK